MFKQTGLKIPNDLGKIQDPKTKNQIIFNDPNPKHLGRTELGCLDIGILEFVWNLGFVSWNFGLSQMWI
jgi:hypothetical protein